MAELQNQDPLSPMDNKDMILQLAQFSAIEGTQNLNENMENYIDTANLATASSLIGKQVVYQDIDTGLEMIGQVDKINVVGTSLTMNIEGVDVKCIR
jgi:flagellar basal-body rod modification protein FlgD